MSNALLFIHALTGLHPGSGAALGVVDLPVQRERHTQWPVIPASAIKGVLRDACRDKIKDQHDGKRKTANEKDPWLITAFGPASTNDTAYAGALAFTDARILAFPVRSLKGVFAWVTCPAVLTRFDRDLGMAGIPSGWKIPEIASGKAGVPENSPILIDGNKFVLEEFDFEADPNVRAITESVSAMLVDKAFQDEGTAVRFQKHFVVLADDDFTHFVRFATEVNARIALDYERKTVKGTALFYEEFLPAETLLYSLVMAHDSRNEGSSEKAGQLMNTFRQYLPPYLQIGGDETTGKGLCALKM